MRKQSEAAKACIAYLKADMDECIEKAIWGSLIPIMQRFIDRADEMAHVYGELYEKLPEHAWKQMLLQLPHNARYWNSDSVSEIRDNYAELDELNEDISRFASILADKLERRDHLMNTSRFHCDRTYHILDFMDQAGEHNGHYRMFVKDELTKLRTYDLKYWPELSDLLGVLANEHVEIEARDEATESIICTRKASLTDYFRGVFSEIGEKKTMNWPNDLPNDFRLSDSALATIANVSLDLEPDEMIDALYVKQTRQRLRKAELPGVW